MLFKKAYLSVLCIALLQVGVSPAFSADKKPVILNDKTGIIPLVKFDKDPDVDLSFNDALVGDVLQALASQVGYNIIINSTVKATEEKIPKIELNKIKLSEAMSLILRMKNLGVKKIGKTLFISNADQLGSLGFNDFIIKYYRITNVKPSDVSAKITEFYSAYMGPTSIPIKIIPNNDSNNLAVIAKPSDIEFVDSILPGIDTPIPQVMIELKLIEVSDDAARNLNLSYGFGQKQIGIGINNSVSGLGAKAGEGAVKSSGFTLNFDALRDFTANFNAEVSALVAKGQAKVLTNPRIATQSGKKALFSAVEEAPIIQTSQTAAGQTQSIIKLPIGDTIDVEPTMVDPVSGYITLHLSPKISSRGRDVVVNGNPVPNTLTRSLDTTMKVRSGESIVLGGLKRKNSNTSSLKVPFLGDIPFLGSLFGGNAWSETESELIIMVTPYILDDSGKSNSVNISTGK